MAKGSRTDTGDLSEHKPWRLFQRFWLARPDSRAAVSVMSNIVESHAHRSTPEFRNFLSIASGSLAEVDTQLIIAERLNYLEPVKLREIQAVQIEVNRMTNALMNKLTTIHSPLTTNKGGE